MSTYEYDDLAALVRADAPGMRMAFRSELDRKVAAGFARNSRIPRPSARILLPAMAVATTLAVGVVVVADQVKDDHPGNTSTAQFLTSAPESPSADTELAVPEFQRQASGAAAEAAPTPTAAKDALRPAIGRKVEHTTSLELTTAADKLQDAADGVVQTTQEFGGHVQSSQVDSNDTGGTATFTLSIPTAHLDDAIKKLSALAHVGSMSQGTNDITGSFVSAADRLSDARAERKALLKALGVATTPQRIATLKERLRNNRSEIAYYNGQLNSLRKRTSNTKVDVTITGQGKEKPSGAGWSIGGAGDDALKVLQVMTTIVLISAAILLPLGAVWLLAALALRVAGRRRREQALDAA